MTQGVFVENRRPKTKKELQKAVKSNPESVMLEATSILGDEFSGPITHMPKNKAVYITGPDPHNKRVWYATITRRKNKFIIK